MTSVTPRPDAAGDAAPTKWPDETRQSFIALIEKWRGLLGLNMWHVNLQFSEEPDRDHPETCNASTDVNDPYMSGHVIHFFPIILDRTADERERMVIHELVHIITEDSKEAARRLLNEKLVTWAEVMAINERLTDWIANIALTLHEREDGRE